MVKEVTTYEASDGTRFTVKEDAERHEVRSELVESFNAAASHRKMYAGAAANWIEDNRELVLRFLRV